MKREIDEQIFNLMDALRSPILSFDPGWSHGIMKEIFDAVVIERMTNLFQGIEMATYPEAAIYLSAVSSTFPMDEDWSKIYIHVTCTVFERHLQRNEWHIDPNARTLNDYQRNYLLNPFLKDIYNKRRRILKERIKEERQLPVLNIPDEMKVKPQVLQTQLQIQF
jgi:hypothetical protein